MAEGNSELNASIDNDIESDGLDEAQYLYTPVNSTRSKKVARKRKKKNSPSAFDNSGSPDMSTMFIKEMFMKETVECEKENPPSTMDNSESTDMTSRFMNETRAQLATLIATVSTKVDVNSLKKELLTTMTNKITPINKRLTKVETDNGKLKNEVDSLKEKCENLEVQLKKSHEVLLEQINANKVKNNDVSQYIRRENLRFYGVPCHGPQHLENTKMVITGIINRVLNANLTPYDIHIAHRLPIPPGVNRTTPAIIVRFYDRTMRNHILKNSKLFKRINVYVQEDMTPENSTLMRDARSTELFQDISFRNEKVLAVAKEGGFKVNLNICSNIKKTFDEAKANYRPPVEAMDTSRKTGRPIPGSDRSTKTLANKQTNQQKQTEINRTANKTSLASTNSANAAPGTKTPYLAPSTSTNRTPTNYANATSGLKFPANGPDD